MGLTPSALRRPLLSGPRGGHTRPDQGHQPSFPRQESAMCPVPRPSARRGLQAGPLLRHLRVPQSQFRLHGQREQASHLRRERRRGRELSVGVRESDEEHRAAPARRPGPDGTRSSTRARNTSSPTSRERSRSPSSAAALSWPRRSPTLRSFARATANRLWSWYLGRGIVHPIEYDHPNNPPSHPELLDALAADLTARKFDLKAFIKDIVLSQTYQRGSELPKVTADPDPADYAWRIYARFPPNNWPGA